MTEKEKSEATVLAISHNLFLTKKERYRLAAGQPVEVIGVNVPVWFCKGISSEPATEVFCKYRLMENPEGIFIKQSDNGYEIAAPQSPLESVKEGESVLSFADLLDVKDGGSMYLAFRQHNKIKKDKKSLNLVHFVEIKDISDLKETLT